MEIELTSLHAHAAARCITDLFTGTVEEEGEHLLHVHGTRLGDFKIKLDTRYAAKAADTSGELGNVADELLRLFEGLLQIEITAPPIPPARLDEIDGPVAQVGACGGRGTGESLKAAFALGFAWLTHAVAVGGTRRLIGFAAPYPEEHVIKLARTDDGDDLATLINDYLDANPERDRALDTLSVFAHLDPKRVCGALPDEPVSPRPTLHDRLPNSRVGDPEWSVRLEWRRWRVIARLPDEPDRLGPLRERFLASRVSRLSDEWRWLRTEALPPRPDVRGP